MENDIITAPVVVASKFNQHFSSLHSNSTVLQSKCQSFVLNQFKNINLVVEKQFVFEHIAPNQVHLLLTKLDSKSAPGVSDIPTIILKHAAPIISPVLTDILNCCIDYGMFPDEWKTAKVIPLYKNKGERLDVNSYRGIAILPLLYPSYIKTFDFIFSVQPHIYCYIISFTSYSDYEHSRTLFFLFYVLFLYSFILFSI